MTFAHAGLDLLEVRKGQLGRAQRGVGELVGAAEQGAADLVQVERKVGFGKAEGVAEFDDERKGIQRLWFPVAELFDGVGGDRPVIQRALKRYSVELSGTATR